MLTIAVKSSEGYMIGKSSIVMFNLLILVLKELEETLVYILLS